MANPDEYLRANREHWEELADVHPDTEFYDVEGFLAGESALDDLERSAVADVEGKSVLHLQCHFGLGTLSWVREGADRVVGVDFSENAVETARDLAERAGMAHRAEFVESDVYDLPAVLDESFDVVFTSYGVLGWLPDVAAWAEVVEHFVAPDGQFFIAEIHPVSHVLMDVSVDDDGTVRSGWPYFSDEVQTFDEPGSYAGGCEVDHSVTHEWSHGLGEIVTALVDAGLVLDELEEHPFACFEQFPGAMRQREDGNWEVPGEDYPLTFSLRAHQSRCE